MDVLVVKPHVIGKEKDRSTGQGISTPTVIKDPWVRIPVVEVSIFNRQYFS